MNSTIKLLAVATLALVACGDNKTRPDAGAKKDAPPADAQCSNCPAAPTLGAQIDRMGRPTINTVLNHGFDGTAAAQPAKKAYNEQTDPATWLANVPEFMKNLAMIDAVDTGFCGNALCEVGETGGATNTSPECMSDCGASTATTGTVTTGCGNQALYNGTGMGAPMATSYQTLAGVMAGDELYLDTSKGVCAFYLAVEFGIATGGTNSTCGGRAPQYDVIDFTLSVGAVGIAGFTTDGLFQPKIKDGAGAHTDYTSTFPFLGAPH